MSDLPTASGWTPRFYFSHYHIQAALEQFTRIAAKLRGTAAANTETT